MEERGHVELLTWRMCSVRCLRTWCSSAKRENLNHPTFLCYHMNITEITHLHYKNTRTPTPKHQHTQGNKTISVLHHDMKLLNTPADVFRMETNNKNLREHERLENRDGFGTKSTQKLFKAIESKRKEGIPLQTLISALGIPQVGTTTAKKMANFAEGNIVTWWALCKEKDEEKLREIVGDASARSVVKFFQDEQNYEICEDIVNVLK